MSWYGRSGRKHAFSRPGTAKNSTVSISFDIYAPRLLLNRHRSVKTMQNSHFGPDRSIRHPTTRNADRVPIHPINLTIWDSGFAQTLDSRRNLRRRPSPGRRRRPATQLITRTPSGTCSFLPSSKQKVHFVVKSSLVSLWLRTELNGPKFCIC